MLDESMIAPTTIRMGFLDSEDRLLVDFIFPEKSVTLLITRRITRRIIQGLAQILGSSNSKLARVPEQHKTEMLIWEHLSATQPGSGGGDKNADAPDRVPGPWPLLARLDIVQRTDGFHLRFEAYNGSVALLLMTREAIHRLVASLRQLARHAQWDLDSEVAWLAEADAPTITPGNLAS